MPILTGPIVPERSLADRQKQAVGQIEAVAEMIVSSTKPYYQPQRGLANRLLNIIAATEDIPERVERLRAALKDEIANGPDAEHAVSYLGSIHVCVDRLNTLGTGPMYAEGVCPNFIDIGGMMAQCGDKLFDDPIRCKDHLENA